MGLEVEIIKSKQFPKDKSVTVKFSGKERRVGIKGYSHPIQFGPRGPNVKPSSLIITRADGSGEDIPTSVKYKVLRAVTEKLEDFFKKQEGVSGSMSGQLRAALDEGEGPMKVKYVVVGTKDGKLGGSNYKDMASLIKGLKSLGFPQDGTNKSRKPVDVMGKKVGQRAELIGQPTFRGLLGPMYDGPGKVRYETPKAYKILSQ
jgi:hypothetical protein